MLWLYDDRRGENAPEIFYTADAMTALTATAIAAGLMDPPKMPAKRSAAALSELSAQVIDFRAARLARLGDGGPDA